MTKVQVNKNIFHFKLSSKTKILIYLVLQYLFGGKHDFETILTSNGVMNIQYGIGKGFGSRERAYYTGVNYCCGPRQTNIPHSEPNYGHGK